MSFKAPTKEFTRTVVPEGTYVARLYSFIDLGVQEGQYKGEPTSNRKVRLTFELPTETKEFDGAEKPLVISKEYTLSMHPKSRLRPVVEALVGVSFTDPEAINFDFEDDIDQLLGKECMLSVSHFEGQRGLSAQIDSVVRLMKGATCPPQFNESTFYLLKHGDNEVFQNLPQFIKDKIMATKTETVDEDTANDIKNLRDAHNKKEPEDISPDDIPF